MNEHELRALVVDTAADLLGVMPQDVSEAPDLTAFPTYTSFRVLDIVESLERRLGTEVDADDLVPANLRRVDSLCLMFTGRPAPALTSRKEPFDG